MSRHLICAALSLSLLTPLLAEDKPTGEKKPGEKQPAVKKAEKQPGEQKPGEKKPGERKPGEKQPASKRPGNPLDRFFSVPAGIELSPDQKTQIEALKQEFTPLVQAIQAKQKALMTPELQQKQRAAMQQAQAEGKKGKELKEAVDQALGLTEEQKAARAELQQAIGTVQKDLKTKLMGILTEEQKAQIKKNAPEKGSKNPGKTPEKNPAKNPEKTPLKNPEKKPVDQSEKTPGKKPTEN